MTAARTSLAAYLLLCALTGLLPLALTDGGGVRATAGAALLALAVGYASGSARGIGMAFALLTVAVASGHHPSVVALVTAAAVAALCLVLLRWPTVGNTAGNTVGNPAGSAADDEPAVEAWPVLRALSLELPIGLGGATGVAVASSARLPLVVGLVAVAGVLAVVAARRRA